MRTYTADEVDAMIGRALARERERVAQQQEPVAFYVYKPVLPRGHLGNVSDGDLPWRYDQDPSSGFSARMLVTPVTSPPTSKPWVELTDEEKNQVAWSCGAMSADWLEFAGAIEAKLKEKNT